MTYEEEPTDEICWCGATRVRQVTIGVFGKMVERKWCPKCKRCGEWTAYDDRRMEREHGAKGRSPGTDA